MKKKFTDILNTAGAGYSLSSDERAKMTRVVREYMAMKPLPAGRHESPRAETYSVSVSYSWFSFAHRPIAAALVLVMIFGSGVSYAAEGALPGDALYAVKTAINEPARLALATNAEAKAEIQIEYAERRIEEAAALAAEGRLDTAMQEELAVAFESHAVAAAEHMTDVESEDSSASIELASRFETRLLAHENVLVEVENFDDTEHSARLVDAIRVASANVVGIRATNALALNIGAPATLDASLDAETDSANAVEPMAMTMMAADEPQPDDTTRNAKSAGAAEMIAFSATAQAPAPDAKTISRMQSGAEKSLKAAQKNLKNAKRLSTEARAQAEADITFATQLLTDGKNFLASDRDADAFASFEESLRVSEQASVYIKAAPTLEKARARNATSSNSRGSIQNRIDTRINIETPVGSVDARVTSTSTDGGTRDADDDNGRDANESRDDHGDTGEKEEDSATLRLLNRFNISL